MFLADLSELAHSLFHQGQVNPAPQISKEMKNNISFNGFHSEAAYNKAFDYITFVLKVEEDFQGITCDTLMVSKTNERALEVFVDDNRFVFKNGGLAYLDTEENRIGGKDLVFLRSFILNEGRIAALALEEEDYAL